MDKTTIYIIIGFIALIIGFIFYYFNNKKNLINLFCREFGQIPIRKDYEINELKNFYNLSKKYDYNNNFIDDITWNDLDLDEIYRGINICKSSVGKEYLYKELHNTKPSKEIFKNRQILKNIFKENKVLSSKILYEFNQLGRIYNGNFSDFYYEEIKNTFTKNKIYYFLGVLPIISLTLLFTLKSFIFAFLLMISIVLNIGIYLKNSHIIQELSEYCKYFIKMVALYNKVRKLNNPILNEYLDRTKDNFKKFEKYKKLSFTLESSQVSLEEMGMKLFNMIVLSTVMVIGSIANDIRKYNDDFRKIIECICEIELAISIANYELTLPYICQGKIVEEEIIDFKDIYHPLVEDSVPNTLDLEKNIVITGSNASGKSTFIKAIGINLLFAQCTGTICARSFTYKPIYIISSMAIRDDVLEGNSYFMKEILSLKRILDRIENTYSICLIDEILRGTNTIERISASATILHKIADNNSFKLIATHDIELSEILEDYYTNYHFAEVKTNGELEFDYKVKKGAVITRNAINLLEKVGYDKDIIEEANRKANDYIETKQWT